MVGLRPPLDPGEPLQGEGGQRQAQGGYSGVRSQGRHRFTSREHLASSTSATDVRGPQDSD